MTARRIISNARSRPSLGWEAAPIVRSLAPDAGTLRRSRNLWRAAALGHLAAHILAALF